MRLPVIHNIFAVFLSFLAAQGAFGITLIIEAPEDVFREAPLIVEASVQDVSLHPIPNSSMGHADITLSVVEVLKGSCPSSITLRRYGIDRTGTYLLTEFTPTYSISDRVIIALREHESGCYDHLGLYNGTFYIVDGVIQNTDISVTELKLWIGELLNGTLQQLPAELPRLTKEDYLDSGETTLAKDLGGGKGKPPQITDIGYHLNNTFLAQNHTWNPSYLPVKFYYNDDDAPTAQSTAIARINNGTYWEFYHEDKIPEQVQF